MKRIGGMGDSGRGWRNRICRFGCDFLSGVGMARL